MSNDQRSSEDLDRLNKAVDTLMEHFDTVQIFATSHEPGVEDGTINVIVGRGNWFARYGQVRHWVVKEDEGSRLEVRKGEDEDEHE